MEQNRRKFLLASATTTAGLLAGCSSEGDEKMKGGDHNTRNTSGGSTKPADTEMTETTEATETTTTQSSKADVQIKSSKLKTKETSYRTEAYILGTIVNKGKGTSGELTVKGRFYDKDDNLLDSTTGSLHYLKPGETWQCYIPYFDDGEKVESHKIDGEVSTNAPKMSVSDLKVTDTKLNKSDFGASITGTIENDLDEKADYLAALGRFWKDDVIISGGLDNITDVPAGENWSFEANYMGYGDRWKDATKFDVIPEVSNY